MYRKFSVRVVLLLLGLFPAWSEAKNGTGGYRRME
jgi:hypothetical protein